MTTRDKMIGMFLDPGKVIASLVGILLAFVGWGLSELWANDQTLDQRVDAQDKSIAVIETRLGSIDENVKRLVDLWEAHLRWEQRESQREETQREGRRSTAGRSQD